MPGTMLPHQSAGIYLTDGGLETTLVFLEGFDLPCFAAFDLLKDETGYRALKNYYTRYLQIARQFKTGFILESPTWRANPDWIQKTGYPAEAIHSLNEKAVRLLFELKDEFIKDVSPIVISGCVGPRGDGYKAENKMTVENAAGYHSQQIKIFKAAGVDMVSAITMNYAEEGTGICNAAAEANLPAVISFTVETDGRLITGMSIREAIDYTDKTAHQPPAYYMINCAHPDHFSNELYGHENEPWTNRIKGIRANASCKSHAELDESLTLDRGDIPELGSAHRKLRESFKQMNVFGGCCGTDEAHVLEIASQL